MSSSTRVMANTLSQLASRGLVILASLLTTALLTRMFGSSVYGDYVFITSFILIFVGISDLGMTTIGVREASADKRKTGEIFSYVLGFRLATSLVLLFFLNFLIYLLPQFAQLRLPTMIASSVIFFLAFRTTIQGVLQSYLRLDLASLLEIFAAIFFLFPLISFWLLKKPISLTLLMVLWSLSALVSSSLGFLLSSKFLKLKASFDTSKITRLAKEAFPLGAYLLVYSISDRGIDSFLLKTYVGSSAVGYYGLAYKIHSNLILGAAFLMNSLFPLLSSFKPSSRILRKTFEQAFTVLLMVGFLAAGTFFVLAPLVIRIISGADFPPSILALRILLPATFLSYLNHLTGYLLVALGKQRRLLHFSILAFLVNFLFNLVFIPFFSFYAAAAITVLTELVLLVLTLRHLGRDFGLRFSSKIFSQNLRLLIQRKERFFDSN
ncbi:MAG TPA: oligosaccharide flippase family protein [Clostridia bacterium]|nr:oligosaccharide flippase family protein [Clostridia bacterium]